MVAVREREAKRIEQYNKELETQVIQRQLKMKEEILAQEHLIEIKKQMVKNEEQLQKIEKNKEVR